MHRIRISVNPLSRLCASVVLVCLRLALRERRTPPARTCRGKRRCNRSWIRSRGRSPRIIAVIVIIITGLSLAFGDTSGGFRRLIQIVFGLSIAFAASSFFLTFFSFTGGALVA